METNSRFKKSKKIFSCLVASSLVLASTPSFSQLTNTGGQMANSTPQLMIPQYNQQDLINQGCDPNNWNILVQDYVQKRTVERQIQGQIQVADQILAAPALGGQCIENMVNQINQVMGAINALIALFTGNIDWASIGRTVLSQMTEWACASLNTYTGNMMYGTSQPYMGQVQMLNNMNGGVSYQTGRTGPTVNTGPVVSNNPNAPFQFGTINSQTMTYQPAQTQSSTNPFNGSNTSTLNGMK